MTEKELLELKGIVDKSEKTIANLEGQVEVLMKDLGFKTIREAENKLKDIEKRRGIYDQQIKNELQSIEDDFGWILDS